MSNESKDLAAARGPSDQLPRHSGEICVTRTSIPRAMTARAKAIVGLTLTETHASRDWPRRRVVRAQEEQMPSPRKHLSDFRQLADKGRRTFINMRISRLETPQQIAA
jgi:hypothetical protein